jgi:hypothetical protein
VALVLSLFGGTYTAIAAIRNHWEKSIQEAKDVAPNQVSRITEISGADSIKSAKKEQLRITLWATAWKYSHVIPIIAFWIFSIALGYYCFFHWDGVTTAGSTINGPDSPLTTGQARWILGAALTVNAICSLVSWLSGFLVRSASKSLKALHKCAEETIAAATVQK